MVAHCLSGALPPAAVLVAVVFGERKLNVGFVPVLLQGLMGIQEQVSIGSL